MKRASIRDLRYAFPKLEKALRNGEEFEITKRKRMIGRLLPAVPEKPFEMPDFAAQVKKIFGKKKLKVTGADLFAWDRRE